MKQKLEEKTNEIKNKAIKEKEKQKQQIENIN